MAAVVLVSGVVGLFGVTSAVLGFIAEAKRLTPEEIYVSGHDCVYPANPANTLGGCAIFLLVVAEIIASAAGGCCGCCCRPPGDGAASDSNCTSRRRVVGIVASVLSWAAAVIAVLYYWFGAALYAPTTRRARFSGTNEECYNLKAGVFVRAAVLSLVATSLAIMSCVLLHQPAATDVAPVEGQQEAYPHPTQGYGGQAPDPKLASPAQGQEHPQVYV